MKPQKIDASPIPCRDPAARLVTLKALIGNTPLLTIRLRVDDRP